jgi:cellulose synthase (UDP-forming)
VTPATLAARGRHRQLGPVLPSPPDDAEKSSYGWRSLPFLTTALAISALCLSAGQVWLEIRHPVLLAFAGYTAVYVCYQLISLPVNFCGGGFSLADHVLTVKAFRPGGWPDVDIFLPVCGEPLEVLRNTWTGVFELIYAYPGLARAYILDDGPSDAARQLSASFGFSYVRRPNARQHQQAGNLNYAFARTCGQHVVVFDAGFRPRADFLAETLPYLDDPTVGIVQTPRFSRVHSAQAWVERAAGPATEVFYRAVQVSADRLGSALCVGSNAVYRRAALAGSGGFALVPYGAGCHTGLDARYHGYRLRYLPVPLATGSCPASLESFARERYRWCRGLTALLWTRRMWRVPMRRAARLPYVAAWLASLAAALGTLVLPLIPVVLLAWLPGEIQLRHAVLLIPPVVTGVVLYPLWHNAPYTPRTWPLSLVAGWAQLLAHWDHAWDHARDRARRGPARRPAPRGPARLARRLRWGLTGWNGTLAAGWVVLAGWRLAQAGSPRFAVAAGLGLAHLLIVGRLIFARRAPG